MQYVRLGGLVVSRFILGSNPFSGFSHQGTDRDWEMRRYFSAEKIKAVIREAEELGVNTVLARTDFHMMRLLYEYRADGGTAQWFAQTCPEVGDHAACVARAATYGAVACHIHGGVMDFLLANGRLGEIPEVVARIREHGMLAGIAGHNRHVFEWAEENLDVDYYMCCYYNPTDRDRNAEHVSGAEEMYLDEDRERMTRFIARASRPVIHYKVLAAGRNDPATALRYAAARMRDSDMVCVGVFPGDVPDMLRQDVDLLDTCWREHGLPG
jgi:hypothetical protein